MLAFPTATPLLECFVDIAFISVRSNQSSVDTISNRSSLHLHWLGLCKSVLLPRNAVAAADVVSIVRIDERVYTATAAHQ